MPKFTFFFLPRPKNHELGRKILVFLRLRSYCDDHAIRKNLSHFVRRHGRHVRPPDRTPAGVRQSARNAWSITDNGVPADVLDHGHRRHHSGPAPPPGHRHAGHHIAIGRCALRHADPAAAVFITQTDRKKSAAVTTYCIKRCYGVIPSVERNLFFSDRRESLP